jgi:hypothetical protein
MWHEGQFEGRRVRVPVFLQRRPDEPPDEELAAWYRGLLFTVADHSVRTGTWQLLDVTGWPDNQSCANLIAWSWTPDDADRRGDGDGDGGDGDGGGRAGRHVVVVNLSEVPSQGQIPLPWPDLPGRRWRLRDLLSDADFTRDGGQLADPGLFVAMGPGQGYLLAVR